MPNSPELRDKSKSPNRALAWLLATTVGLCQAQVRVVLELLADHLVKYYSDLRAPGVVIHTAVARHEPAGKPIKDCKVVPVRLTYFHDGDVALQREKGSVAMRGFRLYRFCCEAYEQGGLLSQEDLAFLLCINSSTVKDLVRRLRDQGLPPPTRGAIVDIGPEPSHKQRIATLLGRGYSTSEISAITNHSEHAIGRYQLQFALVLYLLHTHPEASEDQLCQLSDLSHKAWTIYVEVAQELSQREDCKPHLERLRRRYEIDPGPLHRQIPPGKRPDDLANRRLRQQTLDTALRQTVQEDLGTTRRVAEAVAEDLRKLIDDSFRVIDRTRPGEATLLVDAHDPTLFSGEHTADRKVTPVSVPLYTEEAKEIWRSEEPVGRRRARIGVKAAVAALEQGGIMTVAGLAELLHVNPTTMSRDLRELAVELHIDAPTKGLIEDAGSTLTHKDWIIDLDHGGLTGEEISWLTRHAPASRDRYIETYRRAETLMQLQGRIPEAEELARVLRLRLHVAKQYVALLQQYHGAGELPGDSAGTPSATSDA